MIKPFSNAQAIATGSSPHGLPIRAIWVGVAGDLSVKFGGGSTIVLKGAAAGVHYLTPSHILSATTATDIVGLW